MSQITNLVFCQFASIHFDSQTRQLLTRARNTSTAVQWSLQKYFFTFSPVSSIQAHSTFQTTQPGGTLPVLQRVNGFSANRSLNTPLQTCVPQPPSPVSWSPNRSFLPHIPLLPAISSQPLCPTACTRDWREVIAEKLCCSKPVTSLKRCSLRS